MLADIDETFCLDPAAVEKCITPKTRGIILVHMSGAPGNAKAIQKIARERQDIPLGGLRTVQWRQH